MPIQSKQQPPYYNEAINIKTYIALINQEATDPPTITILKNTIGNIIWTRNSTGSYQATLTNAFPQEKTTVTLGTQVDDGTAIYSSVQNTGNSITIITSVAGLPEDSLLINQFIKIETYV